MAMSSVSLARSVTEAGRLSASVRVRHASNFGSRGGALSALADPGATYSDNEEDNLELWRMLPQLKDIPETLLKKLPLSAMFQLNNALGKEKWTTEHPGVNTKLSHNAKKLVNRS